MSTSAIDSTFGSLLIGGFVAIILYGIGLHQFYRYMRLFSTDSFSIRAVVVLTVILATFQAAFTIHFCYYYLVINYFKPSALEKAAWSANLTAIISALSAITAQSFLVRRVSIISFKYKVLAALAVAILGVRLGADINLAHKGFTSSSATTYTNDRWVVGLICGSSTAVDLILSGSIISVLRTGYSKTRGNDAWLDLMIIYGVNTGLLVLLLDILSLVFALGWPNGLYWLTANLIGTRLAMNTIFCILNSRKLLISRGIVIFDAGSYGANIIAHADRIAVAERWNVPQADSGAMPPAMINIKVTREIEGDSGDGNSIELSPCVGRHEVKDSVAEV